MLQCEIHRRCWILLVCGEKSLCKHSSNPVEETDIYTKITQGMVEKRDTQQKTRDANNHSGSAPQTCRFYNELNAILGGNPTTTPKRSMDTSQESESQSTSGNNEEDILDKEEE
ncbi:hypothetical protein UY3_17766 [Chelonia mydas]|uniref:Uncharacterized protein n=1 Tax=Chelonia mydas TaxID=8469 RepID=M7AQI8_CHEMY|nr:hypothetical protein UY3_17766 [Chelonia mydas]